MTKRMAGLCGSNRWTSDGGAPEIGLKCHAHVVMPGHQGLGQVHGPVGVGGTLHVDPEPGPGGCAALGDVVAMDQAGLEVLVKAQLRRLDGDLDGPCSVAAFEVVFDDGRIVSRHLVGLMQRGQVLAEPREQHADALIAKTFGRGVGILDVLAGHEAPDGTLGEGQVRESSHPAVRCWPSTAGLIASVAWRDGDIRVCSMKGKFVTCSSSTSSRRHRGATRRFMWHCLRSAGSAGQPAREQRTRRTGT